ncbi:BON domain-containing protein [Polaromonas hydrogenivorans]|uniref:BON domain-containing protein n=1 Tax=Polaromonas hydrogenivorans TaxID=335476 RepID=A0AAU7LZT2_9BURK
MKTDLRLQKDITDELKWELGVHAKNIGSEARNGTVTLAGQVATYSQKLRAEHAALRVSGVKSLAVHIDVKCISAIAASGQECPDAQSIPPWTTF